MFECTAEERASVDGRTWGGHTMSVMAEEPQAVSVTRDSLSPQSREYAFIAQSNHLNFPAGRLRLVSSGAQRPSRWRIKDCKPGRKAFE